MTQLGQLHDTVTTALKSGQLGQPVSLRLLVHTTDDHGKVEGLAVGCLAAAQQWLSSPVTDVTAELGVEARRQAALPFQIAPRPLQDAEDCPRLAH